MWPVNERIQNTIIPPATLEYVLHHLMDLGDFQTVCQVPLEERGDEQDLLSEETPDQTTSRFTKIWFYQRS